MIDNVDILQFSNKGKHSIKNTKKDNNGSRNKEEENTSSEKTQENIISNEEEPKEEVLFPDKVMNIMFLGLGASSLITIKIPYYISFIGTFICILIIGIANTWSYYMLYIIYEKKKDNNNNEINNYNIWSNVFKNKNIEKIKEIILFIILSLYSIGEIIIHQILIYRSIGGIINILGGYDFIVKFLSESFFVELTSKCIINIGISLFVVFPSYLFYFKNNEKLSNISSIIGVFIIFFIVLTNILQLPFYLTDFLNKEKDNNYINYYHIEKGFSIFSISQSIGLLFFCFSGHNGLVQVMNIVYEENKENQEKRIQTYKSLFKYSNFLNSLIYFFISICGYLSTPNDDIDLITEKRRFWSKDIIMTITRILLIPLSINKIQFNLYNFIERVFSFFNKEINIKFNYVIIFTIVFVTLIITSAFSLYNNIIFYISFIGGLITIPAFLIPPIFMYNNDDNLFKKDFKYILGIISGVILCGVGLISSIMEVIILCKNE